MRNVSRALTPSYLSIYAQMDQVLTPIRKYQLELARTFDFAKCVSFRMEEIARANQHWLDLASQATASTRMISDLALVHQSWIGRFKPMQDNIAQIQAAAKLSLGNTAFKLAVAENVFAGIDLDAIRRSIALPEPALLRFTDSISGVITAYEKLAGSIPTFPDLTHLPTFALPGASREIFTTGYALDAIVTPNKTIVDEESSEAQLVAEVKDETSECIELLRSVDPALVQLYVGAREALHGTNADRVRHVLSSLRELWNHLLRRLAPDENIYTWIPEDTTDLLHEGRPTRRARVLYVCRDLDCDSLSDFLVQDTRALVEAHRVLQ